MSLQIEELGPDHLDVVAPLVEALLAELGEEGEELDAIGKRRGWRRIDVTAPQSDRWARTRVFYEQQGFAFTGPKLKLLL